MGALIQDLRFSLRTLWKSPAFTAVAVLTLALGIGANTAVFTVINSVMLRSLPYREPGRLVWMSETAAEYGPIPASYPDYTDWKAQARLYQNMGAIISEGTAYGLSLTGAGEPARVQAEWASRSLFETLGTQPLLGRGFSEDEDHFGGPSVILLSYAFWQKQFGGDPRAIGAKLTLDDKPYTVIGIMPPGFRFYADPAVWISLEQFFTPEALHARGIHYPMTVIGRLKPGVSLEAARSELAAIQLGLQHQYPQTTSRYNSDLKELRDSLIGTVRPQLLVLSVAMALILLIACANIANLLLSRSAARRHEIAVRISLGAGRARLIRQLLTESVLISLLGGIAGVLLGLVALRALTPLTANIFSPLQQIAVDARVLGFAFVLSLATGVLFGLAPAWQLTRPGLQESLAIGGRSRTGAVPRRLRESLVVGQMMLALVMLAGAGLLMRAFLKLQQVNLGYDTQHVLTMRMTIPTDTMPKQEQRINFYRQAADRLRSLPGVQDVAYASSIPVVGYWGERFGVEGLQIAQPHDAPIGMYTNVSPGYFHVLGIPILRGRAFSDGDSASAPKVAVVGKGLADHFWPGKNPIGQKLHFWLDPAGKNSYWVEVVGEVPNIKDNGPTDTERYQFYIPAPQENRPFLDVVFMAYTQGDPRALAGAAIGEFKQLDPMHPLYGIETMGELAAGTVSTQRMELILMGIFAALALVVAAIGIYGVVAYAVSQQTRDIGVRMALGAQPGDVLRLFLGQGLKMVTLGILAGLAISLVVTRWMASVLFNTSPYDAVTYSIVPVVLAAVALLATYIPARRATRVDPMVALRWE